MSQKNRRFEPAGKKIKKTTPKERFLYNGELGRVRTADPLIKSLVRWPFQNLYIERLSNKISERT